MVICNNGNCAFSRTISRLNGDNTNLIAFQSNSYSMHIYNNYNVYKLQVIYINVYKRYMYTKYKIEINLID